MYNIVVEYTICYIILFVKSFLTKSRYVLVLPSRTCFPNPFLFFVLPEYEPPELPHHHTELIRDDVLPDAPLYGLLSFSQYEFPEPPDLRWQFQNRALFLILLFFQNIAFFPAFFSAEISIRLLQKVNKECN